MPLVNQLKPDTSFYDPTLPNRDHRSNRAPGDLKPSYKWSRHMADRKEFRQAYFIAYPPLTVNIMNPHPTSCLSKTPSVEIISVRRVLSS
ncbi:hypothetical protein VTN77DRAFT_7748 [Rasamsonia byssochlamydoides]|uniref:uncharacterized protein n=1 Tax=Rasamsonia byssochlamydoides TaxID=89139 RepID=UPI0037426986